MLESLLNWWNRRRRTHFSDRFTYAPVGGNTYITGRLLRDGSLELTITRVPTNVQRLYAKGPGRQYHDLTVVVAPAGVPQLMHWFSGIAGSISYVDPVNSEAIAPLIPIDRSRM